ncbi:MAG: hypothetical protein GF398_21445 [Chitinivibrionales bacterium]|nr:hypothetical protein [Chitinivibrionales bacterium]
MDDKRVYDPHNAFVRRILTSKETAVNFLSNYLPPNIHKQLNMRTLKIVHGYVHTTISI